MDLTKVFQLYGESKEWQEKGFEAFVKIFGKVVWDKSLSTTTTSGWPCGVKKYFTKLSKVDKNYVLKFVLCIQGFDKLEEILEVVSNDITENTYDYVISNYKLNTPTWNHVQVKYERMKKERIQMKMKELEVEKATLAKELEEMRNKKRKIPGAESEKVVVELEI